MIMLYYSVANTSYGYLWLIPPVRDFQEINYPKKRTTEAQSTQRENFCISFGTFFYLEVS